MGALSTEQFSLPIFREEVALCRQGNCLIGGVGWWGGGGR